MPTSVARLIRPDNGLPVILHATDQPRTVAVTSLRTELVEMHRHYDVNTSTLVPCECDPRCCSHRIETFASGIALVDRDKNGGEVWEEVLLQLTNTGMVALNRQLQTKHETTEIRGATFIWQRRSKDRNSSVMVTLLGIRENMPRPFDIGWCLLKRRSISMDFFKEGTVEKRHISKGKSDRRP